jgi:hypothetical protein
MGRLDIGIVADRAQAPDIWMLADHWEEAVAELRERAEAEADIG